MKKILIGILIMAAFSFSRECHWTDVDIHNAGTQQEFFYASYECDDGYRSSTSSIHHKFLRIADGGKIIYYIRYSGTPICEYLGFNNGVFTQSATPSKCGL